MGDNKGASDTVGNTVLVAPQDNVPGTVVLPVATNDSYLRFRGTSAQGDVATTLTAGTAVAELGACRPLQLTNNSRGRVGRNAVQTGLPSPPHSCKM